MSEDRLILAIGRLERALSRVEAAAGKTGSADIDSDANAALRELSERHDRLKAQVESAIGALDQLIAKG